MTRNRHHQRSRRQNLYLYLWAPSFSLVFYLVLVLSHPKFQEILPQVVTLRAHFLHLLHQITFQLFLAPFPFPFLFVISHQSPINCLHHHPSLFHHHPTLFHHLPQIFLDCCFLSIHFYYRHLQPPPRPLSSVTSCLLYFYHSPHHCHLHCQILVRYPLQLPPASFFHVSQAIFAFWPLFLKFYLALSFRYRSAIISSFQNLPTSSFPTLLFSTCYSYRHR